MPRGEPRVCHVSPGWWQYQAFCGIRLSHRTRWYWLNQLAEDPVNHIVTCVKCAAFFCVNCGQLKEKHVNRKCLFSPTTFKGRRPP